MGGRLSPIIPSHRRCLSTETKESQFSLKLKLNHEDYPRRAWAHIPCPPRLTPQFPVLPCDGKWDFSVLVKAQDLEIEPEGRVCFVLEKYRKKPGVDPRDISGEPDEVTVVEFPQGSYDFTRFSTSITIDEDTASLLVYAAAQHAGGTVWLENPQLLNERGDNILPQFTVSNPFHEYLNWMGENLSRKDWTDIEATLNGETFFVGELFQRCHRFSENEIAIPANLMRQGENTLELRNVDDYFSPIPYRVKKVEILYGACEEIGIVSCPSLVYANAPFGVLVQVKLPAPHHRILQLSGNCPCEACSPSPPRGSASSPSPQRAPVRMLPSPSPVRASPRPRRFSVSSRKLRTMCSPEPGTPSMCPRTYSRPRSF
ncbi:MAG: hypothetical protein ACLRVT_00220 [Oscillospiraceae bacterium]